MEALEWLLEPGVWSTRREKKIFGEALGMGHGMKFLALGYVTGDNLGLRVPVYSQWCRGILDRYPHSNCLRSSGNGANSPEKVSNWSSKYANAFIDFFLEM
ncbi:hypothetical protein Tco_0645539 [Tanacetum coccineum]